MPEKPHSPGSSKDDAVLTLFGQAIDPASPVPWLIFGAIAVGGIFAVRKTFPQASGAWNDAINKMRARVG